MVSIVWLRRDLRFDDNTAFINALAGQNKVLVLFIFDTNVLNKLKPDDARVSFIYNQLEKLHRILTEKGSGLLVKYGDPFGVWKELLNMLRINGVYYNRDYEPYAIERDTKITHLLMKNGVECFPYKDQVIFEPNEILKTDGSPYTVFTPYKKKWLEQFRQVQITRNPRPVWKSVHKFQTSIPAMIKIGFTPSPQKVKHYQLNHLGQYAQKRDFPALDASSYLGVHLRFGTVSIRQIVNQVYQKSEKFLSELIWREFFMQILHHFPRVVSENFKTKYNGMVWRNDPEDFKRWCLGQTGYPIVDAGMRQLKQTGYMHNRVRMITASFLCKHLLTDWRWGEAWFAQKLLDYELSSNNGNWQWAAGTGCDAAPYFRVFNPEQQTIKFDPEHRYIKRWVPEYKSSAYPAPIIDHAIARERALTAYKTGTQK